MSLGLFSVFRGPWPNLEPPHHRHRCNVTQTHRGAQCYLVSTTPWPFLRKKKDRILMKTLGFSGEGRSQCLLNRLVFISLALQVTAQCSLIGSDCLSQRKENSGYQMLPPLLTKSFFLTVLREAAQAVKLFPQACTTNLTLTYENGLLSTFTSSLVLLVGHLLRSTHSCFAWAGISLIIFVVGESSPKLLVHVKFNEGFFDTCLINIAKSRPDLSPL